MSIEQKIILGIETSCDETAVAILEVSRQKIKVAANIVNSQIDIHSQYGGVVPEVAARQHNKNIIPLVQQAIDRAQIKINQVDYIAATQGPGLHSSLMAGLEAGKTLAWLNKVKFIPVNHLWGHIWSYLLPLPGQTASWQVSFPFLSLVISGGHTELALIKSYTKRELLGQTVDDAAGEAFDKVAKMLGLGYPGGPILSKLAKRGDSSFFSFPRPLISSDNYDFSFSGLKTAVLYTIRQIKKIDSKDKKNIAASFEKAVVDVLLAKVQKAEKNYHPQSVVVSGGVSANLFLRQELKKEMPKTNICLPHLKYTGDNAAMIALAGYFFQKETTKQDYLTLAAQPNMSL